MDKQPTQADYAKDIVDAVIHAVAETLDDCRPDGLWAHLRRDPEAFRRAVRGVMDRRNMTALALETVRTGGAVCTLDVRHKDLVWRKQHLITGADIDDSVAGQHRRICWSVSDLAEAFARDGQGECDGE